MKNDWTMSTMNARSTARLNQNHRAALPSSAARTDDGANRTKLTSNGVATAVSISATRATMSHACK